MKKLFNLFEKIFNNQEHTIQVTNRSEEKMKITNNKPNTTVSINGTEFRGKSIEIVGGKVIVDGLPRGINLGYDIRIEVNGDVDHIDTGIGNIHCKNVGGNIKTSTGDVYATNVTGNITTGSGDVHCDVISGDVKTGSGDIHSNVHKSN